MPRILWNRNVHYRIHKCPSPVPILSHINPAHASPSHVLKKHFNIIPTSTPICTEYNLTFIQIYTRLDKIKSEVIRKELEIPAIQDVRLKYKQNWINHLERMDNTRLPKHALNYKPRGRRDRGRQMKRWQCVDAGTGQTT